MSGELPRNCIQSQHCIGTLPSKSVGSSILMTKNMIKDHLNAQLGQPTDFLLNITNEPRILNEFFAFLVEVMARRLIPAPPGKV